MRRSLCVLVAVAVATANLLTGCVGGAAPKPAASSATRITTQPFTTSYATAADTVDFFLANDDVDTIAMAGPLYGGYRGLPSQDTGDYDKARTAKLGAMFSEAEKIVSSGQAASEKMASLRSAYVTWVDIIAKQEPRASGFAKKTVAAIGLAAAQEGIAAAEYRGLASAEPTSTFAAAFGGELAIAKAEQLAGMYLKETNDIAGYAALGLQAFASSTDPKIVDANKALDSAMAPALAEALTALKPVADSLDTLRALSQQLAAGDYLFSKSALEWMQSQVATLAPLVGRLQPRDGLSADDVANIKTWFATVKDWQVALSEHFAGLDAAGLPIAAAPSAASDAFGVTVAYAAEPATSYQQSVQTLQAPPEKPKGWLASGWDVVKSGFGKAKTAVGVTVDTLGVGVQTISAVGCGIYYGNSGRDIIENTMAGVKDAVDNYHNGLSGSSTFATAKDYIEGAETGSGQAAGATTKWAVTKVFGAGKVADGTAWVANGLIKNTAGLFTGLAKGIYKVADKGSSNGDVASGLLDIGLSAIGGSKVIVKGSQIPGMLKSGFSGLKAATGAVVSLADSAANKALQQKLEAEIATLMVAKGLTAGEAKQLISNQVRLEVQAAVGQMIAKSRETMVQKIRDLIASGATARWTNFSETAKGSLRDLLRTGFDKTFRGFLDAGTTVIGANYVDYIDNLIGSQLDNALSDIVAAALATPPDPGQVNGTWSVKMHITKVDAPGDSGADAKKQGCDIDFSKLVGQTIPATFKFKFDETGHGTVQMSGKGVSPSSGSATYSDGTLSFSLVASKWTITVRGVAALEKGGVTGSGTWSMSPGGASKFLISGNWTGAKK